MPFPRQRLFPVIALIAVVVFGPCAYAQERSFLIAPSQLPDTTAQMNTPGFWISRHANPDQVIMSPNEIQALNKHIRLDLKLITDIFSLTGNFRTENLVEQFGTTMKEYREKGYYLKDGSRQTREFLEKVFKNMKLNGLVLGVEPRYGLVIQYANQRFLPTDEGLYESNGDLDFDQLQNSSLEVGTPVAILHVSADRQWYYTISPLSQGWVHANDVVMAAKEKVREYFNAQTKAVIVTPKADIYLDEAATQVGPFVRMGTVLAFEKQVKDYVVVKIPVVNKDNQLDIVSGYIPSASVHVGFLPMTARTIFNQAFVMLNQPYGWGGMRGEQDCSAFMDMVFATMGIVLPRDSKDQAKVGQVLAEFNEQSSVQDKQEALKGIDPSAVLLPLKGHIMLYLGQVNDKPYAIHAIWAYRVKKGERDVPLVVNRVVVSSLMLGEGSSKGSLLKRTLKAISLK